MERERKLQDHLESLLAAEGKLAMPMDEAVFQLAKIGYIDGDSMVFPLVRAKAREIDRQIAVRECAEDFVINPLAKGSELTKPVDIIQAAKDFYGKQGYSLISERRFSRYEAGLLFSNRVNRDQPIVNVYLDMSAPGSSDEDNGDRIWVTCSV